MTTIAPGSTIGILGGGQLGRMIAIAAAQLGYRTHIFAPEESGPAADVSPRWTRGDYDDPHALAAFADSVDVVTYEFENIAPSAVETLAGHGLVRPGAQALRVAQGVGHIIQSFAGRLDGPRERRVRRAALLGQ